MGSPSSGVGATGCSSGLSCGGIVLVLVLVLVLDFRLHEADEDEEMEDEEEDEDDGRVGGCKDGMGSSAAGVDDPGYSGGLSCGGIVLVLGFVLSEDEDEQEDEEEDKGKGMLAPPC